MTGAQRTATQREEPMTTKTTTSTILVALLGLISLVGCTDRDISAVDPTSQSSAYVKIKQMATTKVDMLFVIDNSGSMGLEQEILSKQIVLMARELIQPSDGSSSVRVEDLHIGIISTDMGTHGYTMDSCDSPSAGDNGILQNTGRLEGCMASYNASDCDSGECPWLVHSDENPDDGSATGNPPIWEDFGCIATLGTNGCGFEQQLEASLQALRVQTEAGRPNEGFLRDDSLLAIVYVTDEDDCSTPNGELFNRSANQFGPLNTRCALNPDELYPIDRYVEGFRNLRPGMEDMVVVAAITGVPIDGSWRYGDSVDILREMQRPDPSNTGELLPSCDTTLGKAYPPVRFAELVYAFGHDGIIESICQDDWSAALQAITRRIQHKLAGTCMQRPVADTGAESCRVLETLVGDQPCPHPADADDDSRTSGWQIDQGLDESGNRVCEILPSDYDGDGCPDGADCSTEELATGLQGWFYVTDSPECVNGMVRFTSNDVTSNYSNISFECRTALCPHRRQCVSALDGAAECDPNVVDACGDGQVCVRHNSGEICGWTTVTTEEGETVERALSCALCSPTLSDRCSTTALDWPMVLMEQPLVDSGGCCAEGFHCENGGCVADRSTTCR